MPLADLPEDVLRHVLTCATPKELLQASTTSTHNRRAALDEHIWLPLCRAHWGLPEGAPVDTRAPAYELYPLARPPPSLRCGFRAATKLRCSRTSSGLIEVAFEGELGVPERMLTVGSLIERLEQNGVQTTALANVRAELKAAVLDVRKLSRKLKVIARGHGEVLDDVLRALAGTGERTLETGILVNAEV